MSKKNPSAALFMVVSIIFLLLEGETVLAQDTIDKVSKPVFIQASLLYDFPQSYGMTAGINFPINAMIRQHVSRNGQIREKQKEKFWGIDIGTYRYPYNSTGMLLMPFVGVRPYVLPSFFWEPSLGLGLLRTFYDGKVYEVDAAGNVKQKALYGRFYATAQIASGFNFLLQKMKHPVLALQIKPALWFQYPFNSFIKPHVSLEAGIKYEVSTRTISVRKITKYLRK